MKILSLSTKLPYPPKDGGAIGTLNIALGLASCGNEISMLTFNTSKHFFNIKDLPEDLLKAIRIYTVEADNRIKPFAALLNFLFSNEPYISERYKNKEFTSRLIEILNRETFDLVQLEGPYLASYVPFIRKYSDAVISLRAHNIEHEIWERRARNEKNPFKRIYFYSLAKRINLLERKLLFKVDSLVPVSERDSEKLAAIHPWLPQIVIPAGIDFSSYLPSPLSSNLTAFFIGALDWGPNIEGIHWFVEKVWPGLQHSVPQINMHIAGRNPSEEIKILLEKNGIHFHGEVEDAKHFMTSYDIMVLPLLSGSGIRIKLIEALALGRAVISTSIGAEGLNLENGKHLLIEDEPDAFAKGLINLLSSGKKASALANSGLKHVMKNFNIFDITSKLTEFYSKLP